jgi:predicted NBD/HSP70 family sugar kinase
MNARVVLDALRETGALRVTEIVAATGLSRPTVDAVVDDLVRLGWLAEADAGEPPRRARGRPGRLVVFRADAGHVLGIDIGERKARAAVADLRGEIVAERRHDFAADDGGRQRLAAGRRLARRVLRDAGVERTELLAACVGVTGGVDARAGEILFSSAFRGLEGPAVRQAMERTLGREVALENDCNLAVLGERWRGAARDVDDAICMLAAERLGAGIVVGGRLVRGHGGVAGELPFRGAFAEPSGSEGIACAARRRGAELVAGDGDTPLARMVAGDPARVEAETVFDAARAGDTAAADIVAAALEDAGQGIVTMALVLNPEVVVVGGGVAGSGDLIAEPLRRRLAQMVRMPPRREMSSLGGRGALLGAIRHALDEVEPRVLDGVLAAA